MVQKTGPICILLQILVGKTSCLLINHLFSLIAVISYIFSIFKCDTNLSARIVWIALIIFYLMFLYQIELLALIAKMEPITLTALTIELIDIF